MKNLLISAGEFARTVLNSVYLYKNIWRERTTLLVHGPAEADKIPAVLDIISAAGRKVVYVSASDSILPYAGRLASIPDVMVLRPAHDPDDEASASKDYADLVIDSITEVISTTDIRTFVIDSVSRIAALSFGRNASAAYVMKRLVALQIRTGCSFLVLADNSTRAADRTIRTLATSTIDITAEPSSNPEPAKPSEISENSESSDSPLTEPRLAASALPLYAGSTNAEPRLAAQKNDRVRISHATPSTKSTTRPTCPTFSNTKALKARRSYISVTLTNGRRLKLRNAIRK